jgi:hypothetical protein
MSKTCEGVSLVRKQATEIRELTRRGHYRRKDCSCWSGLPTKCDFIRTERIEAKTRVAGVYFCQCAVIFGFKDFCGQRYFTGNGEDKKKNKGPLMEGATKRTMTMKRWRDHAQQSSACI